MYLNYSQFIKRLNDELSAYPNLVTEDVIRHLYIDCVSGKKNSKIEIPYFINARKKTPKHTPITPIKMPTLQQSKFSTTRSRADLYVDKFCCEDSEADCEYLNEDIKRICIDGDCVFEFKFNKKVDTSTTAHTDNFGYVFNDMNRLSLVDNKHKLLVYVFDDEMYNYYTGTYKTGKVRTDKAKCPELCGAQGTSFKSADIYSRTNGKEFKKCAFSGFNVAYPSYFDYNVEILYSHEITPKDGKFYLCIYEIK